MMDKEKNGITDNGTADGFGQTLCRSGFWISLLIAVAAAAALGIATTTAPARSGPFCMTGSCIVYPYTDAAEFVPIDYIWMYPAFFIGPLFIMLVACVYHYVSMERKLYALFAVCFAVISSTALSINYFIQLTVVQTCFLKGEVEGLSLFSQYNPHGIFIALEDIGYLMMSVAFLFIAIAFARSRGLERAVRIIFIVNAVIGTGSLIALAILYGAALEYRYEVVSIVLNWLTLIVSGVLLSVFFKRALKKTVRTFLRIYR